MFLHVLIEVGRTNFDKCFHLGHDRSIFGISNWNLQDIRRNACYLCWWFQILIILKIKMIYMPFCTTRHAPEPFKTRYIRHQFRTSKFALKTPCARGIAYIHRFRMISCALWWKKNNLTTTLPFIFDPEKIKFFKVFLRKFPTSQSWNRWPDCTVPTAIHVVA